MAPGGTRENTTVDQATHVQLPAVILHRTFVLFHPRSSQPAGAWCYPKTLLSMGVRVSVLPRVARPIRGSGERSGC